MKVRPTPKVGPINRTLLAATAAAAASNALWSIRPQHWSDPIAGWMMAGCAAALLGVGTARIVKDYQLRKVFAAAAQPSSDHGSSRQPSPEERAERGLDAPGGNLLGIDEEKRAVWRPLSAPYALVEGAPGSGKTIFHVINTILHYAMSGISVVVNDPKGELSAMLTFGLRAAGIAASSVNPLGVHIETVGNVELHPFEALIDALYGEGHLRQNATSIAAAYADLLYPVESDAKNPFFVLGSQSIIGFVILALAVIDPANCTPTRVFELLSDPARLIAFLHFVANDLEGLDPDDPIIRSLHLQAKSLIHRSTANEEHFGSFLEGAKQRLKTFEPAGPLGDYGRNVSGKASDVREGPCVTFLVSPLTHTQALSAHNSLVLYNIVAACKAKPNGHKVHFVVEEALNVRFHELTSSLEMLRELGVSADFFIQSFPGLEKLYGREAAAAIEACCDVRIYLGVNTLARAEYISKMLSDETRVGVSVTAAASAQDATIGINEFARAAMKPNEILGLKHGRALVFVRGLQAMNLEMVHYGQIDPYRDWVSPIPINGSKIYGPVLVRAPHATREKANA